MKKKTLPLIKNLCNVFLFAIFCVSDIIELIMNNTLSSSIKSALLLFLASVVWGAAFVAQSIAGGNVGTFTFNGIRFLIGGLCLLPFVIKNKGISNSLDNNSHISYSIPTDKLIGGTICGIALFLASTFQQYGIELGADAGEAGFLTACYIVLVPILGIFIGRKCSALVWPAVAIALVGLYLLCFPSWGQWLSISTADLALLGCAFMFSIQILCVDYYAPKMSPVALACVQFFVSGFLSLIAAFIFDFYPDPSAWIQALSIPSSWISILYTGLFSCGVGYTLQAVGQRNLNPAIASLIMSLESVFSTIFGWLILHQVMTGREALGCAFIFAAVIIAQLPVLK